MKIAILTTDNREHTRDYTNPVPWFGTAPEALLQGFAALPDVEVHVVSCARARMSAPEKLAPNIFFHSLVVPKIGWMQTAYQGCIRATRKLLRQIKPDIVHGQGTERDNAMCAVFSGLPNVLTIHGNMREITRLFASEYGLYGWLATQLEDFALKKAGGVFCNSAYTEGLVRPRARKTWRVPNAIREQFFSSKTIAPPSLSEAQRARPVLINVGVATARKRQRELLQLGQELYEEGLPFELWFVGGAVNAYAQEFLAEVNSLKPQGWVRHLGTKGTAELVQSFDQASGLIHFPTEEAFGLVVAEGLARGLKLFGAKTGGVIDIAAGVTDAELFEVDDWPGLKRAVAAWIGSGAAGSEHSAEIMRQRYHPQTIAKRHLEIYREVLSAS